MASIDETIVTEEVKTGETAENPPAKTFTQEDIDRIVTERLKKERKSFEKEKSEIERLASLSAEEKEREKFKKEKEEFENEKKLISREKMKIEIGKQLEQLEIPSALSEFIVSDDADTAKENIDKLTKAWKKALDDAVSKKIAGKTPEMTGKATNEDDKLKQKIFAAAGIKL